MSGDVAGTGSEPVETIDFSGLELPEKPQDLSFDAIHVPDLVAYLKDIRDNALDYVVPGPKLEVKPVGLHAWELWLDSPEGIKIFKPTHWAEKQTVDKTPLPRRYHRTLLDAGKSDLAAENLNTWLQESPNKVMVRTVGDKFRAMVSDGYRAFDNLDLFAQTAKAVEATNQARATVNATYDPVQFFKAEVTETDLFISLLDKGQAYDIGKGDNYNVMLTVRNSEVGKSSMSIEPSFFRGWCLNLYSREPALRKVHRGEKLDEGIFSADTRETQRLLWTKEVRDVFNATLQNTDFFDKWAQEFRESKEVKIEDPTVAVHKVAEEFDFSQAEEDAILRAFMVDTTILPEDRGTGYALVNALTVAAKDFGVERTHEVAKIAGNVPRILKVVA